MIDARPSKRCSKCGRLKTLGDYYADPRRADGLRSRCKSCIRAAQKTGACSRCGSPVARGAGSAQDIVCRDCRQILGMPGAGRPTGPLTPRPCQVCGTPYATRRRTCSPECAAEARRRGGQKALAQRPGSGYSRHPLYVTWGGMRTRCYNPNAANYHLYGGRGIGICAEWRHDFRAFEAWILANLGPRPDGMSLDRYPDNDGDYRPGNVRWATDEEQSANRRCSRPPQPPKQSRQARREERAALAARGRALRESGASWQQVADEIGLQTPGGAYLLVHSFPA